MPRHPTFVPAVPFLPYATSVPLSPRTHRRTTPVLSSRAALASPTPPVHPSDPDPDAINKLASPIVGRAALDAALREPFTAGDAGDTLVVVMFHARWCRVCKTLTSKLPRVAASFPHVRWLRIDFAEPENKPVCAELGVKLLPTFRFYGGGGATEALEEFTSGPFGVKRLEERLEPYREGWRGR